MSKIAFFIIFVAFVFQVFSQPNNQKQPNSITALKNQFEGIIKYKQLTPGDTTYYTYYVKGDKVRVDVFNEKTANAENMLLYDLTQKKITVLNPERKLFVNVTAKPQSKLNPNDFTIIKSQNKRTINGYECYQWRVKNQAQKTEISYWVANDNFVFFNDLMKLWDKTDKHALFFLQISENVGYFPMEAVERTLLRDEKMRLEVTNIKKQKVADSVFAIPTDYKSYEQ